MALEVAQLIARFRRDTGDPELPGTGATPDEDSLWSDQEIIDDLDQAQREFARRTHCFPDFSAFTAGITADEPYIEIDTLISDIRFAVLSSSGKKIMPATVSQIEEEYGTKDLMLRTGEPSFIITDLEAERARLFPIPTAADDIMLAVYRYPEIPLTSSTSKLEIEDNDELRLGLLLKVKALAYGKYDADAGDTRKADDYEQKWENFLVDTAVPYFKKKRRTPRTVRYGGI